MSYKAVKPTGLFIFAIMAFFFASSDSFAMNENQMKMFQAKKVKVTKQLKQKTMAILVSRKDDSAEKVAASSDPGKRVLVIVDGVLVEMNAGMVDSLIRGGIFKVVWAGTSIPVDPFRPIWH